MLMPLLLMQQAVAVSASTAQCHFFVAVAMMTKKKELYRLSKRQLPYFSEYLCLLVFIRIFLLPLFYFLFSLPYFWIKGTAFSAQNKYCLSEPTRKTPPKHPPGLSV